MYFPSQRLGGHLLGLNVQFTQLEECIGLSPFAVDLPERFRGEPDTQGSSAIVTAKGQNHQSELVPLSVHDH
jgi:hypothetical protein